MQVEGEETNVENKYVDNVKLFFDPCRPPEIRNVKDYLLYLACFMEVEFSPCHPVDHAKMAKKFGYVYSEPSKNDYNNDDDDDAESLTIVNDDSSKDADGDIIMENNGSSAARTPEQKTVGVGGDEQNMDDNNDNIAYSPQTWPSMQQRRAVKSIKVFFLNENKQINDKKCPVCVCVRTTHTHTHTLLGYRFSEKVFFF